MNSANEIGPRSRIASAIVRWTERSIRGSMSARGGVRGHPARIPPVSEEIRKAASVIAVREELEGPQVLVVERSRQSRFLPGYVVFPGWRGGCRRCGARATRGSATPAEAARAAAVRELAEEAGLVLTAPRASRR